MELPNIGKRMERRYADLVGIDFSTTATKLVRLKKGKDGLVLAGLDLLPAVDFNVPVMHLELPRDMSAFYGCLAYTAPGAVVRMLHTPLQGEETVLPSARVRELLNVDESFRASSMLINRGAGRKDSSFLAAAIPEKDIRFLLDMFPAGPPAPASVEVAGLSFINAFLHARREEIADEAVCLMEIGDSISHFAFLNKGRIGLVGKFRFGGSLLRSKVMEDLGLDEELADNILRDSSINISNTIMDVMGAFLKQLSISKDFIERHQGCRVSKMYLSGGVGLLPGVVPVVRQMLKGDVVSWSPFEKIHADSGVIPEELASQLTRFAAAAGAAIGGFEQK